MKQHKKLFIFDIDGTLSLDKTLFEGSKATLEAIKGAGSKILLFTNNSSLGATDYLKKLSDMGLNITRDELFTSSLAAVSFIKKHRKNARVFPLATRSAIQDFVDAGITIDEQNPDLVVLALNPDLTYNDLKKACLFIENGAEWIATHDDPACPTKGGFAPDAGAFIELIKITTGKPPSVICGKPYSTAAEEILRRYKFDPSEIVMTGDRLHADIKFGKNNGFFTVLVLSGGTTQADLNTSPLKPDKVINSIAEFELR